MKITNIAPNTGIEPTCLVFQASVVTITSPRLHDVTTLPTFIYLCGSLPERLSADIHSPRIVRLFMLTITYIQAVMLHMYTQGRFKNRTAYILYSILVMAVALWTLMKIGNIVPRAGIEPISLAFQTTVLTISPRRLPDVTAIHTSPHLCSSLLER